MTRRSLLALIPLGLAFNEVAMAQAGDKPRLLVLPWLVIDRETNTECSRQGAGPGELTSEARSLAQSAQATLDRVLHSVEEVSLVPRSDWEPEWKKLRPAELFRQGPGCAICTPAGSLIQYSPDVLRTLAVAVRADYVWLGVAVASLAPTPGKESDACCREALAQQREEVMARSSVLLVRASDGQAIWQRDARRLRKDVPTGARRVRFGPKRRREIAVDRTSDLLGEAFRHEVRRITR